MAASVDNSLPYLSTVWDIFEKIFQHILQDAVNNGFVDASAVFIDGTHIKASANKHKTQKVTVTKPIPQYKSELDQEIDIGMHEIIRIILENKLSRIRIFGSQSWQEM